MTEPMNAEAVAQPRRVYIDRSMVFDAGVTWTTVAGLYPHAYVPEEAYLAIAAENATLRASEAAAVARVKVLTDFIAEFAEYKFDALRSAGYVSPEDEPDDYTDLGPILAWQEDAASILTPTTDKEPKT